MGQATIRGFRPLQLRALRALIPVIMGLFGVANGADGDLRPGLPSQMVEIHDPIRLMVIVEHFPEVVLNTIKSADAVYEWYINEWVNLVVIHPETKQIYHFADGEFNLYNRLQKNVARTTHLDYLFEHIEENIHVHIVE